MQAFANTTEDLLEENVDYYHTIGAYATSASASSPVYTDYGSYEVKVSRSGTLMNSILWRRCTSTTCDIILLHICIHCFQVTNNTDTNWKHSSNYTAGSQNWEERPSWLKTLEKISHWLLIVNSSCNIVIYLYKDPKFKVSSKLALLKCVLFL